MNPVLRVRAAMSRLRLGQQLFASFAVVVFLTALVGLVALRSLSRVEGEAEALANKWMTAVGHLATERIAVLEARDMEIKHSRTGDASYHGEYEAKFADARKALDDSHHLYQALVGGNAERDLVKTFDTAWQGYQQAVQRVMKLGRDGQQPDAADISDGAASMAFDEALNALDALTRFNFEGGRLAGAQVRATYVQAQRVLWALLGLALVMALAFASMITRGLMRQLGGEPAVAARIAQAVAAGDLTTPIRLRAGDAGSLMAQLHLMQASLAQAVTAVRQGAEYVACASTEIAQGNHDLSGRTEQQAGALLQTTATMDALAHTVSQNSDSSLQADQLAQGACGVARKGGDVVQQVVATMHGINDSSRRIADIVGVIDSIAFQTNILALNAAVEAARAGEQGRGFAVVASEVRNLAQRSSGAAREIKTLIDASVERVCTGTALVDQAGQTMQEIVAAIQRVTQIVGEISAASVEQRAGVGQVGQAVAQMDSAIQQNAALVEQSAVATESLKAQAHKLVDAVAVFQLADAAH